MRLTTIFLFFVLTTSAAVFGQDTNNMLADLDARLSKGKTTISAILSNPAYEYLHGLTPFRQLIRKFAGTGKITIVSPAEPGKKITVKGTVLSADGRPLNNLLIYFYHTSDKGWYADTAAHILVGEGDRGHARLFGYLKTDKQGQFEFETVQPRGYPGSDFPGHIHLMAWKDEQVIAGLPNELQFEDDPRLTPVRKTRSLREGNLIAKNTGTGKAPLYFYKITLR